MKAKPSKTKIVEKDYESEGEKAADSEMEAVENDTELAD